MTAPALALEAVLVSKHPSEDDLEAYVMGSMPATDQARLEHHVLVCATCCDRLEEAFTFVEALKDVLARLGFGRRCSTAGSSE
jgi:hypothetical protein